MLYVTHSGKNNFDTARTLKHGVIAEDESEKSDFIL